MRALPLGRLTRLVAVLAAAALLVTLPAAPARAHITSPRFTPTASLVETTLRNMIVLDMVWDPVHGQLYAVPFAGSGTYSYSLVAIDPVTKTVTRQLQFGSAANHIDASDDFSTLVISLGDHRKIVIVDVATFTVKQEIPVGTVSGQDAYPDDVAFLPGSTDTFAATLVTAGFYRSVTLYKAGARMSTEVTTDPVGPRTTLPAFVRFLSPTKLVGIGASLFEFNVTSSGITFLDETSDAITAGQQDLVVDSGGLIWANSGRVFNATTNATVGTLPTTGPMAIDESRGRVYQGADTYFHAYDKRTRALVGSFKFTEPGRKRQAALFGNGFAIATDFNLVLLTPPRCADKPFTILGTSTTINGTPGDDVIYGTSGDDVISGGGGNDIICGADGNDQINGGDGNDLIVGGAGDDTLFGGAGADEFDGGMGTDAVKIGFSVEPRSVTLDGVADDGTVNEGDNYRPGIETILGSPGDDHIVGSDAYNEYIVGGAGNDTIDGRAGNDFLVGDQGDDILSGGDGNDRLIGGAGADDVDGGNGRDIYSVGTDNLPHNVSLNDIADDGIVSSNGAGEHDNVRSSIETVVGSPGADTFRAGDRAVWFVGGAGDDALFGGPGNDVLEGRDGNDYIDGAAGSDFILAGNGNDICIPSDDAADTVHDCEATSR